MNTPKQKLSFWLIVLLLMSVGNIQALTWKGEDYQKVLWTPDGHVIQCILKYTGLWFQIGTQASSLPIPIPTPFNVIWDLYSEGRHIGPLICGSFHGAAYPPQMLSNGKYLWVYQEENVNRANFRHIREGKPGHFSLRHELAKFKMGGSDSLGNIRCSDNGEECVAELEEYYSNQPPFGRVLGGGLALLDLKAKTTQKVMDVSVIRPILTKGSQHIFCLAPISVNSLRSKTIFSQKLLIEGYGGYQDLGPTEFGFVLLDRHGHVIKELGAGLFDHGFKPSSKMLRFWPREEEFEADLSPDEKLIATREGLVDWQGNKIADFGRILVAGPRWSTDGTKVAGLVESHGAKEVFIFSLPQK